MLSCYELGEDTMMGFARARSITSSAGQLRRCTGPLDELGRFIVCEIIQCQPVDFARNGTLDTGVCKQTLQTHVSNEP